MEVLANRGMNFSDVDFAERCFDRIGYYRLSAYWYPFRRNCADPHEPEKQHICDHFCNGTSFDDVYNFYLFDKRLRLKLNDPLERIEIAIRAQVVELLGSLGPYAHTDPRSYGKWFTKTGPNDGVSELSKFTEGLQRSFARSNEEFAKHFRRTYFGAPPIWIAAGAWDWGNLSFLVSGLSDRNKAALCQNIHPDLKSATLVSWLAALNEVRNTCAHHSRLWNKALTNSPGFQKQGDFPEFSHLWNPDRKIKDLSTKRLYGALIAIIWLMKRFYPKTRWHLRLAEMIKSTAPTDPRISPQAAGFPVGWQDQIIWTDQPA